MQVKCTKCGYIWDYKGDKKPNKLYPVYVTCPTCKTPIKLKKGEQSDGHTA